MIVTVRLEADGTTLDEVVKDIDDATKALKLSKDMHIHDEHYERVHESCYKGRRVFKVGVPGATAVPQQPAFRPYWGNTSGTTTAVYGAIQAVNVPPHPRQKNMPQAKK